MITMSWIILFLPLLMAVLLGYGLRHQPRLAGWLGTGAMALTFILSLAVLARYNAMDSPGVVQSSFAWMQLEGFAVEFGIYLNGLTLLMLLVVTGIGTLVFLFSMSYMQGDSGYGRYFASLSLFAFSMLGIVLANNFIQIFIFWELVGLSSYLLIGFWFHKPEASTAGKKAFITTRVGDVGMMIGILALFGFFATHGLPTFNFITISQNFEAVGIPSFWMTFIGIGLFLGVVGKSAQVPLHVWLPDAMEGPTPVSALIHAATMVAAGIFLLARVVFVFEHAPDAQLLIAWSGAITCLVAALIAIVQDDIKKVLAYSTLSQLGYMVMALGLASATAGMFHLTTHAFFKALLFLGAGSLIHALHTQDIWQMGTLIRKDAGKHGGNRFHLLKAMPFTGWTFLIATAALMGLPPLSGFFSKEEVLAVASHGPAPVFIIAMATVALTAFYMGRLVTVIFYPAARPGDDSGEHHGIHEGDWRITVPLIILGILSVIGGFLPIKDFVDSHAHGHHGGLGLALASQVLAIGGFAAAFFLYRNKTAPAEKGSGALQGGRNLLTNKLYFDKFYDLLIRHVQEKIARVSDIFERYIIVEWSVNGLARTTRYFGNLFRKFQTGVIQFYAFIFILGLTLMIYFVLFTERVS